MKTINISDTAYQNLKKFVQENPNLGNVDNAVEHILADVGEYVSVLEGNLTVLEDWH